MRHAKSLGLVQAPNHRSSHAQPTPQGGGLGIVLCGVASGLLVYFEADAGAGWILLVAGLSLTTGLLGLVDDVFGLSARLRLAWQTLSAFGLVLGFMGQDMQSGLLLCLGAGIVGIWWLNLFNFMDGTDGIAAMQAIFMLGMATWSCPDFVGTPWMIGLLGATSGFLWLNRPPAKIFMGDVGSTYLAFMILGFATWTIGAGELSISFWLVVGALFVSDATATLIRRILSRTRFWEAHRSHAYQRLARRWQSHGKVWTLYLAINGLWVAPWAIAAITWPAWEWYFMTTSYLPLLAGAWILNAGKPD